jgi:P27 family predicted phage terminase small subunit
MPARKPTRLKIITGTARKDRQKREPEPKAGTPRPPSWLDAAASRFWHELVPELEAMRVLTHADREALGLTCTALAEHQRAAAIIAEHGLTYPAETRSGTTLYRERPEVRAAGDAWRRALRGLSEFGLTPTSRGRLDVEPQHVPDPADEFFT